MAKRQRRLHSQGFKEAAVRRLVAGERVRAVARELRVAPRLLYHWWSKYDEGGAAALRLPGRPRGRRASPSAAGAAPAARVVELERKVGQQALELDFFARALRHIEATRRPSAGGGATASSPSSRP